MKTKKYKAYSFRLNEETYRKLKEKKEKKDISWNRFIYKLLKEE